MFYCDKITNECHHSLFLLSFLYSSIESLIFSLIPGALKGILQKLGDTVESVDIVGSRIARALNNNPSSWVAANLGALYWRVQGEAAKAIDCVKVAYANAPRNARVSKARLFWFVGLRYPPIWKIGISQIKWYLQIQ